MDYCVSARVSRWARCSSPSTYQHGHSVQVGVPVDATFERLSICGATRQVHILTGLRDLVDPEARRLHIYLKRATEFLAGAEVLLPSARGRGDFPVLA